MADVFLSYSQTDRDRVSGIIHNLEDAGRSVWWDAQGRVGAELDKMVQQELEAASCVVVVWSSSSVQSDWVLSEADEGRKRRILVPVAIDEVEPPIRFRCLNTVSLSNLSEDSYKDALKRVMKGVEFHVCSNTADPTSLQIRGYEIALDRIEKGEALGSGKYFSILNNRDPVWLLTSEFGWSMGSDDYGPIKCYYLNASHPDLGKERELNIIRVFELKTLKKDYPDSWKKHIEHLSPLLVLDYSCFQLLENTAAEVGGSLYRLGKEPIAFYAPLSQWSTKLAKLLC